MAWLIAVKFPLLEAGRQHRLAVVVGVVGVCQGTFMIVVFTFTQSISGRARWGAINNFGLLPLFAG